MHRCKSFDIVRFCYELRAPLLPNAAKSCPNPGKSSIGVSGRRGVSLDLLRNMRKGA